jgi:hypothetical protein
VIWADIRDGVATADSIINATASFIREPLILKKRGLESPQGKNF